MEKRIKPKVEIGLLNTSEGGCSCKTLGIGCTCPETEVVLYEELDLSNPSERKEEDRA